MLLGDGRSLRRKIGAAASFKKCKIAAIQWIFRMTTIENIHVYTRIRTYIYIYIYIYGTPRARHWRNIFHICVVNHERKNVRRRSVRVSERTKKKKKRCEFILASSPRELPIRFAYCRMQMAIQRESERASEQTGNLSLETCIDERVHAWAHWK